MWLFLMMIGLVIGQPDRANASKAQVLCPLEWWDVPVVPPINPTISVGLWNLSLNNEWLLYESNPPSQIWFREVNFTNEWWGVQCHENQTFDWIHGTVKDGLSWMVIPRWDWRVVGPCQWMRLVDPLEFQIVHIQPEFLLDIVNDTLFFQ